MQAHHHISGFPPTNRHHGSSADAGNIQPLSLQWLTEERIANTQQVWSRAYGREVCRDEAIEILLNVRRLAEVVLKQQDRQESP